MLHIDQSPSISYKYIKCYIGKRHFDVNFERHVESDHVVDMMTEKFIIRVGDDDSDSSDDESSSDDSDDDKMATSSTNTASSSGFHVTHDDLMEGVSTLI